MKTELFDFTLPADLIAQHPVHPRSKAKLLHVSPTLHDLTIAQLGQCLREHDLLLLNNTKVIPSRFLSDRNIEVTLIEQHRPNEWWSFAKPGRKVKKGEPLLLADGLMAEPVVKKDDGMILLRFDLSEAELFEKIEAHGHMPLPPYIKRAKKGDQQDLKDYQPVFAQIKGAVAAPTASLHLDFEMLNRLEKVGIDHAYLTLHVGAGTFLPVKSDDTDQHHMHAEWIDVGKETIARIEKARSNGGRIVCVGTTALRAIESAAQDGTLKPYQGKTDIFITPGFRFKVADMLLTNFHLPKSTLFMLISAFSGLKRMKAAYVHAIECRYRFFSYGDACLLHRFESDLDE